MGSYSQISLSHCQNAYSVQYMEEGDFFVLLLREDALKFHYTQPLQCRIPCYYVVPREDVPRKMTNAKVEVKMAATVDSMVGFSQASPLGLALQGSASLCNKVLSSTQDRV